MGQYEHVSQMFNLSPRRKERWLGRERAEDRSIWRKHWPKVFQIGENLNPWIKEAQRTPSQIKVQKATSVHNIIKLSKRCYKKNLKICQRHKMSFKHEDKRKIFFKQLEAKIIVFQQTWTTVNVKGISSGRGKLVTEKICIKISESGQK